MSQVLVFSTPGVIDMRAFSLMGVSAKPNTTSPIGYFGTGLKYAMAVLVRMGSEPVVLAGRDRYTFQKKPIEFRGQEFDGLQMRREKWSLTRAQNLPLPFTTSYGRNWKPWQVVRELESNTRDENGWSGLSEPPAPEDGYTHIVVSHPEAIDAWLKLDEIFLPNGQRAPLAKEAVQVMPGAAKHLYWRSLRVAEPHKSCLRTWNVLSHIDLTEDRTLAYEYWYRQAVASHVLTCDDERLIYDVLTAKDDYWEHGMEFGSAEPSRAFRRVMDSRPKGLSAGVIGWWGRHDGRVRAPSRSLFEAHPRPWRTWNECAVVDKDDREVFIKPDDYTGNWETAAMEIIKRCGATEDQTDDS